MSLFNSVGPSGRLPSIFCDHLADDFLDRIKIGLGLQCVGHAVKFPPGQFGVVVLGIVLVMLEPDR